MPTTLINLNNTTPAAPSNSQNVRWQADGSTPINVSANVQLNNSPTQVLVNVGGIFGGDSGFTYDGSVVDIASVSAAGPIFSVAETGLASSQTLVMLQIHDSSVNVMDMKNSVTGADALIQLNGSSGSTSWAVNVDNGVGIFQVHSNDISFITTQAGGTCEIYNASGGGPNRIFFVVDDATIIANTLIEATTHTPSSSSDTGTTGQFAWDGSFFYVCIATNSWARVAIAGGF